MWLFVLPLLLCPVSADVSSPGEPDLSGTSVDDVRGHEMRDQSLVRPYASQAQWTLMGDAILTSSRVRLTRDVGHVAGAVWSKNTVRSRDWEIHVNVRISTPRMPADGFAIWYTAESGIGPAYGAPEQFTGIGIVVDTFENDVNRFSDGQRFFPQLSVVFNQGDKRLDGGIDGDNLRLGGLKAICKFSHVLNEDIGPKDMSRFSRILVRYVQERLEIYYAEPDSYEWTHCQTYKGLHLPLYYRVGMTASNGELSSAHEVQSFKMYSLDGGAHSSHEVSSPMFFGPVGFGVDDERSKASSGSVFWSIFKLSFYSALVAVVLIGAYLVYNELRSSYGRKRRFY